MFGEFLLPGSLLGLQQLGVGVVLRDASVSGKCALELQTKVHTKVHNTATNPPEYLQRVL